MKKRLFYLITGVIVTTIFAACTADITTIPMGVTLNYSSVAMVPGDTLTLKANIMPNEAEIKTLTWISTDTSVATVIDGVVTAISEGEAIISVITNSGQKSAFCRLSIAYPVSGITLNQKLFILNLGKSTTLNATVLPLDAPDKSVRWESSASNVAEVNEQGTVIAKSPGTAVVSAITNVGHRIATCTVKVPSENHIAMVWQPRESASLFAIGDGTIDIDWGDGTAKETITLSTTGTFLTHIYTNLSPCVVIINHNNNITRFDCSNRQITSLTISPNTSLVNLDCTGNQLKSLDLSNNTELAILNCGLNQLSVLNVSNTKITILNVSNFSLTSLDVSNNAFLTNLNCSNNRLTSLDLSSNPALTELICSNNQLTSLDLKNNTELVNLNCSNNPFLSSLNVSNTKLTSLNVSNSSLTSLDVSNNPVLSELDCKYNQLSTEALNNLFGTLHGNTITGGKTVYVLGNPGMFNCNQSIAANKGWVVKIGNYMTMTLRSGAINMSMMGGSNVAIDWGDGSAIANYTLNGQWGWQSCYHYYSGTQSSYTVTIIGEIITGLNCVNNQITSLNVSANPVLTDLYCGDNRLTSLDVSKNTVLRSLWCNNNQITNLNVSPVLSELHCNDNQLTSLDVSKNPVLRFLNCHNNKLTSLNVSSNPALTDLRCSDNQLTSLDVSKNTVLRFFWCNNNKLTEFDVSKNTALADFNCSNNQLSTEALNALFRTLHNYSVGNKVIRIGSNPGTNTCDQSIATARGWFFGN